MLGFLETGAGELAQPCAWMQAGTSVFVVEPLWVDNCMREGGRAQVGLCDLLLNAVLA